jgi:sulfatase modifying factor 1
MKQFLPHLCALLLVPSLPSFAAPPTGILANQGKLKPVVTVANSYSEKVVRTFAGDSDSGPIYEIQQNAEKVSAKVMALLGDFDFSAITGDTEVALSVGDFSFSSTLGEAGARKLEASGNATFTLNLQVPQLDADGGAKVDAEGNELFTSVRMGTVSWVWNAASKRVTATLALVIPGGGLADTAGVGGIASDRFASLGGQIPTGGERRFGNQPVPVAVRFGPAEGSRDAFVGGVTRTRAIKMPGAEAPYLTTSVVLAGGADTRGPQLSVRVPAKAENAVAVFAGLADRPAPSGYSTPEMLGYAVPEVAVYVDQVPGEGVEPDFLLSYCDSRGNPLEEGLLGLNAKGAGYLEGQTGVLGSGTHTLTFVAMDSEGNTAFCAKTVATGLSEFVRVEGGTLPPSSQLGAIAVNTCYIGRYEVQWGEFQTVRTWAAANGYDIGSVGSGLGTNYPVTHVSWYQAVKWCNARSEKEGMTPVYKLSNGAVYRTGEQVPVVNASANGYRLLSEKEWEWAARGGTQTHRYTYSGSNDVNAVAWYDANSGGLTHVVGTKAANELGTFDMSGNVWEWCFDYYDGSGAGRVIRGGLWPERAAFCAVGHRINRIPTPGDEYGGFRLALSSTP